VKGMDLNDPLEKTMATALSLPPANEPAPDEQILQALGDLHAAAHGRSVETIIGSIPIAPPLDSSLKSQPSPLTTRSDLLLMAR